MMYKRTPFLNVSQMKNSLGLKWSPGMSTLSIAWSREKCLGNGIKMIGHVSLKWLGSSYGMIPICLAIAKTKSLVDVYLMTKFLISFPFVMMMHMRDILVEGKPPQNSPTQFLLATPIQGCI